jgi:hypothetical protein
MEILMNTLEIGYKYPTDFCNKNCPCSEKRRTGLCPGEKKPNEFINTLPERIQKKAWEAFLIWDGHRAI